MEDFKKLGPVIKKVEKSFELDEKKTLSIRLSESSIEKLEKRVDKLKKAGILPRKVTISSYLSLMIDSFAKQEISEKGDI